MEYPPCFNAYNNIEQCQYRQKSQTLQPIRDRALIDCCVAHTKELLFLRYFSSMKNSAYENVSLDKEESPIYSPKLNTAHNKHSSPINSNTHNHLHHHQHLHNRSHSHHYYDTTYSGANDLNNYYNLAPNTAHYNHHQINPVVQSRQQITINEPSQPQRLHSHHAHKLDTISVMQVCTELGILDAPPPMPSSRNYTISSNRNTGQLIKILFPQRRMLKSQFTDTTTGISLSAGSTIRVVGPTASDRKKFTIHHQGHYFDIPHKMTQTP